MSYSCDDIYRILESGDEAAVDVAVFEKHIRDCPDCGRLCGLENEIEASLRLTLAHCVPADFRNGLIDRAREIDTSIWRARLLEGATPVAVTAGILFLSIFIKNKWDSALDILRNIDLTVVKGEIVGLMTRIKTADIDISGAGSLFGNSPLALFALVSAAAVVWIFSLLEFEKNLK